MNYDFIGVEFKNSIGGGLAVVHYKWLTPQKSRSFWPPSNKAQRNYHNFLRNAVSPDSSWKLYEIERIFFESGK